MGVKTTWLPCGLTCLLQAVFQLLSLNGSICNQRLILRVCAEGLNGARTPHYINCC